MGQLWVTVLGWRSTQELMGLVMVKVMLGSNLHCLAEILGGSVSPWRLVMRG